MTLTIAQLIIATAAVLVLLVLFAANRYRVAGANEALIISGARGSKIRDEALRVRLNTDPHSPSYHRVIGVLSNAPEFHEAFGCARGSAWWRAPEVRPTVW